MVPNEGGDVVVMMMMAGDDDRYNNNKPTKETVDAPYCSFVVF